ncbi:isoamylase [Candidatus Moduliflexus flocculans]|uniref:Isoamylase n=1 Tax=Candidatus Moduliflexus flocculans TaxID=1499966 RepID=A0A0S6VSD7_9BACT|nr:isoamylase [Candidatus Moduliflexus flocculans]
MPNKTTSEPRSKAPAVSQGNSFPLGASATPQGVNFSIYSKHATGIELLFFNNVADGKPAQTFGFDQITNRTGNYWHLFVPGVKAGQIYGYRVSGEFAPEQGLRFDAEKILLDPYGLGVAIPSNYSRDAAKKPGDNTAVAMKSVVVDPKAYDWEGDAPLRNPSSRTIVYEMHVRGFTRHSNSGVAEKRRGTYAGLIEKIPYLKALGITAVELLPVFQFDPQDSSPGHINYWGYAPISYFAPHQAYSSRQDPLGPVDEFRDMVKALHRAGIEVILDVVYNHTAEGDETGPTLCFRGLENEAYYILKPDKSGYENYTGCGNTLNTNEPICRRIVLDSLRYWVQEMHVDGFRFDLASILSRDASGQPLANPPVLWDIDSDPVLAGTKIIAEAWDAAGLYQVGHFIGDNWKEWNGRFRDDVRRFLRGDEQTVPKLADRLLGSPEIYGHEGREAEQSVNFVTCHDGFTLYDLVSYNQKHNEANGEENRDGSNDNCSWNCGVEGPTDDPAIKALRLRQMKNFHAINMLSLGLPMMLMGDEVGHSQQGNNNTYCQDNELNWFNWELVKQNAELHRFVSLLAARRVQRDIQAELHRLNLIEVVRRSKIEWHGVKLSQPDWGDNSHALALSAHSPGLTFYWILNAYWEPLTFELPGQPGQWKRWVDTSLNSPDDIVEWEAAPAVSGETYTAGARSVVVLFTQA